MVSGNESIDEGLITVLPEVNSTGLRHAMMPSSDCTTRAIGLAVGLVQPSLPHQPGDTELAAVRPEVVFAGGTARSSVASVTLPSKL